jgi:5-amino-6-(5-phosphoribosylamino)uracil reductase
VPVPDGSDRQRRPFVLLSCAVSLDGCLDDTTSRRLVLSSPADLDRVDEVRAGCDAILVGAGTLRSDDPRLLVRSPQRRAAREAAGLAPSPMRVVLTGSGDLDPDARFFTDGAGERLVYCAGPGARAARSRLGAVAQVLDAGDPLDLTGVLADLAGRGVRRLLVEGGAVVHRGFLRAGAVDELHLVVAPFFVGAPDAPRLLGAGRFPPGPQERADLVEVRRLGDVVLLRYRFAPA